LAREIWEQTGGKVDALSTARTATSPGVATILKQHRSTFTSPSSSPPNRRCSPAGRRPHKIEDVGSASCRRSSTALVDEIVTVKTDDAKAMARQLARGGPLRGNSSARTSSPRSVAERWSGGEGRHADGRFRPQVSRTDVYKALRGASSPRADMQRNRCFVFLPTVATWASRDRPIAGMPGEPSTPSSRIIDDRLRDPRRYEARLEALIEKEDADELANVQMTRRVRVSPS
jgi:hypothetical protein